jgi:hypothetical protein
MSERLLRFAGLSAEADFVSRIPISGVFTTGRPTGNIRLLVQDSDTFVRSIRRSGLRYVALLVRATGRYRHAADYLERAADSLAGRAL